MPAEWLYDNGFGSGDDVTIIGKHNWPEGIEDNFKTVIFDICDNHFDGEWRDHYLKWCEKADAVTCNSKVMKSIIAYQTGRDAVVIPDPVEGDRLPPHIGRNLLWFGNKWNFKAVQRVIPNLAGYDLQVVSAPFNENVIPWSPENMRAAFNRAGMVILPASKSTAKSANRLIETIQAGCFAVAEELPSYQEFRDYAWIGSIREGCDWVMDNQTEALKMISRGQDYISQNFTMDQIGPRWAKVINGTH